jgi:NADP-dependent 3-hydroxy acid dehydrogenase YdfG
MSKRIFITGASSGIGKATAFAMNKDGYELILAGRREDRLKDLANELQVPTKILVFDISNKEETKLAYESLPEEWKQIDILINNAGNAHGFESIHEGNTEDWDKMMDINVKGLLYITRLISPGMVKRNSGHIINLSSTAGKFVYPNGGVYCASKFAVEALTQGMRMDFNPYHIKVSSIAPGAVNTEFSNVRFKGDQERADKVYEGFQPLLAEDIAEVIRYMIEAPAHVNLADITIMPTAQASFNLIKRN